MKRLCSWYINSVAGVLVLTGLAKLLSATGRAKILDLPDPLLPVTKRAVLLLVGLLELSIALYLLLGKSQRVKFITVEWLGCNFILYRLGMLLLTVGSPCPCLGLLTERLHLSQAAVDAVLRGVVFYLVFGSLFFLLAPRRPAPPPSLAGAGNVLGPARPTQGVA